MGAGDCEVNDKKRRSCRACRLDKCVAAGMLQDSEQLEIEPSGKPSKPSNKGTGLLEPFYISGVVKDIFRMYPPVSCTFSSNPPEFFVPYVFNIWEW